MDRIVKSGGAGLIAVSYEARAMGVKRQMSANEARKACPELITVMVPTKNGKADLSLYKENGEKVVEILQEFAGIVEKRSVDEVALDVTDAAQKLLETTPKELVARQAVNVSHFADSEISLKASKISHEAARRGHEGQHEYTKNDDDEKNHLLKYSSFDYLLLAGAVVINNARKAVRERLGFSCSAGIAANKMIAKVGCGLHKPNQQTIVFPRSVAVLLKDLPLNRLPGLGGDLGNRISSQLNITTAGGLANISRSILLNAGFQDADNLLAAANGTLDEPVKNRANYKSFGSSKTFYKHPITNLTIADQWLSNFAQEIFDRIKNDRNQRNRAPTNVTISITTDKSHVTRTEKVHIGWSDSPQPIVRSAHRLLRRWAGTRTAHLDIVVLGLGVSNFIDLPANKASVMDLLTRNPLHQSKKPSSSAEIMQPSKKKRTIAELLYQQATTSTKKTTTVGKKDSSFFPSSNIDPEVFAQLPPEIKAELLDDRTRLLRQSAPSLGNSHLEQRQVKKKKKTATTTIDSFFAPRRPR